jgi:hypothetical protein
VKTRYEKRSVSTAKLQSKVSWKEGRASTGNNNTVGKTGGKGRETKWKSDRSSHVVSEYISP